MLNPISAHIEFIERNNVLREVVADAVIRTKLAVDRFFRCQQISDLNIQLFAALVAYKINFLISVIANLNVKSFINRVDRCPVYCRLKSKLFKVLNLSSCLLYTSPSPRDTR